MSPGQRRRCRATSRATGRRCRTTSLPTSRPTGRRFFTIGLDELLRLDPADLDELDKLDGDPSAYRTWWRVRRWGWAVQDQEAGR
jgi:hypothetical protein